MAAVEHAPIATLDKLRPGISTLNESWNVTARSPPLHRGYLAVLKELGTMAQVHTDPMSLLFIPAIELPARITSFPFLSLPPELRDKVYFELLHSTEPVYPDLVGIQEFYSRPGTLFHTGCALIRACKLVEAEATSVLYQSNNFKFRGGTFAHLPRDNVLGAKSVCGILGIYIFLSSIGSGNRAKIRHVLIEPCHFGFFVAKGENFYQETAACRRQYLKAVELLSRQHGLETFEITIDPLIVDVMAMFRDKDANAIQMMSKIKGLKEFRCWEPKTEDYVQRIKSQPDKGDEIDLEGMGIETVRWLKKEMTAPKIEARMQPPRDSTATVRTPSRSPKLAERVAILEQERKQLANVMSDSMTRLEKTEKEIEELRGAVRAIADMI